MVHETADSLVINLIDKRKVICSTFVVFYFSCGVIDKLYSWKLNLAQKYGHEGSFLVLIYKARGKTSYSKRSSIVSKHMVADS
jgi:hypothetical protein